MLFVCRFSVSLTKSTPCHVIFAVGYEDDEDSYRIDPVGVGNGDIGTDGHQRGENAERGLRTPGRRPSAHGFSSPTI